MQDAQRGGRVEAGDDLDERVHRGRGRERRAFHDQLFQRPHHREKLSMGGLQRGHIIFESIT